MENIMENVNTTNSADIILKLDLLKPEELETTLNNTDYSELKNLVFEANSYRHVLTKRAYFEILKRLTEDDLLELLGIDINKSSNLCIAYLYPDLFKFAFSNGVICDLLPSPTIREIIKKYDNTEFLSNLFFKNSLIERLSNDCKQEMVHKYFKSYAELKNKMLDENIGRFVDSHTLATMYCTYVNPTSGKEEFTNNDFISIRDFTKQMRFSFEKSVFFLQKMDVLTDENKMKALKTIYPEYKEENEPFTNLYNSVLERVKNGLTNGPHSSWVTYDCLEADLEELSYDEDFFKGLSKFYFSVGKSIAQSKLFFAQLVEFANSQYGLNIEKDIYYGLDWGIRYSSLPNKITGIGFCSYNLGENRIYVNASCNYNNYKNIVFENISGLEAVGDVFHELRHKIQRDMAENKVSLDAFLSAIEFLVAQLDYSYYIDNHDDMFIENDANNYRFYYRNKFLEEFFPKNINVGYGVDESLQTYFQDENVDNVEFYQKLLRIKGKDRFLDERSKVKKKNDLFKNNFSKKLDYFKSLVGQSLIISLRNSVPTLKLVTDESGNFYSNDEILELEKKTKDPNTKLFYRRFIECYNSSKNQALEGMLNDTENYSSTSTQTINK